jgi:uncharacterized protein (TIGR02145 family)
MGNGKIKVVGYAKRVFYDGNIEYRNFSDSLVGQQITSSDGTTLFTSGSFNVTINNDPKVSKLFKTNKFSNFVTLNTLELTETQLAVINDNIKIKLNLDKSNLSNYAYFGSLREFVRISLEHIISNWPASIFVNPLVINNVENTVENYSYDNITNISTFKTNTNTLDNKYGIKYLKNGVTLDTYTSENDKRNLTVNYNNYVISGSTGEYNIIGYTGATSSNNDYIYFQVIGNPFTGGTLNQIQYFHIKPSDVKINEFFVTLPDFEKYLLNRRTTPIYTSTFVYTVKSDEGLAIESKKQITWPSTDGYNIDFNTTNYTNFVTDLLDLSDASDSIQTNIISRFLVSNAISDFDTVSKDNDDETEQKMDKTLKIYGREFDEIKHFTDGLALVNAVSYNKQDNTPDATLKALARTLGWDLTSSLEGNDFITSFLTPSTTDFSGETTGLTPAEAEIEMWRRIILNTPWIWKSKGTRKAIEFFFKFIGAPNGLIRFNEHVYKADGKINMDTFLKVLEINTNNTDITNIPIDSDGYPKILGNTPNMYFQKAGLWYRQTAGPESNIDILGGNNPHIGPYDGGNEYMNQFRCLIPNFSSTTLIQETILTGSTNLFSNYNNGVINGILDVTSTASCATLIDWGTILSGETENCYNNNVTSGETQECPDGYVLSPDGTECLYSDSMSAVFLGDGSVITAGDTHLSYGSLGSKFYTNITNVDLPIIKRSSSPHNPYDSSNVLLPYSATSTNTFWKSRLNTIGVKGNPATSWNGFAQCYEFTEDKTYYIGLAADNYSRFYINHELIVDFSTQPDYNHSYWYVFPYDFKYGKYIIEMEGRNLDNTSSFGFEIYDPIDFATLTGATDSGSTGANVIWSTKEKRGEYFDFGPNLGWSCTTEGYVLDTCGETPVCTKLIHTDVNRPNEPISAYTFNVDWRTLYYIDNELVYTSPVFYSSSDRIDTPSQIDYTNSLQLGGDSLKLSLEFINDEVIYTKTPEVGDCDGIYNGKTFETKLHLNTSLTLSGYTNYCESILDICDTNFSSPMQPTLYIDVVDETNTTSPCFSITPIVISDPCPTIETTICGCPCADCDNSIRIDIKKSPISFNCGSEYVSYSDVDGYAVFIMENGTTKETVSPTCCPEGYSPVDEKSCETRCQKNPIQIPPPITCDYPSYYYNWYAVGTGKLAPIGWHVPTLVEFNTLVDYLTNNGYNYDGSIGGTPLVAKSLALDTCWTNSGVVGSVGNVDYEEYRNKSGLSLLGKGYRLTNGTYIGYNSQFNSWTSTDYNGTDAYNRLLNNSAINQFTGAANDKRYGCSIICIKDDAILSETGVFDYDGNQYGQVKIGNQVWMVGNLIVTHYNDGTPITLVQDDTMWSNLITDGYCIKL